jgi:hypothetical protein
MLKQPTSVTPTGDHSAVCSAKPYYGPQIVSVRTRILQALHSVVATYTIYYYVIANYLNPGALLETHWSLSVSYCFGLC